MSATTRAIESDHFLSLVPKAGIRDLAQEDCG